MSFAILEAMNAGLPCVVTDVGGNRDLAETGIRCGTVVNYGDTEGFARAILELMENEDLRDELSKNAVKKVSDTFDLNKLAWDVFRAYQ
jgi:glycosyltransferase involved in cell wall biosynthesis